MNSRVLGIIGPSGCGKSTVVKALVDSGLLIVSPSWTDRPRRAEPEQEHVFVTNGEFDKLASERQFMEIVQPFGLPYRYGFAKLLTFGTKIPTIMLRADFVHLIKRHYPDCFIYQIEADYSFVERSIIARGDNDFGSRLQQFETEIVSGRKLADRVFVNQPGHLSRLVVEISEAIQRDF